VHASSQSEIGSDVLVKKQCGSKREALLPYSEMDEALIRVPCYEPTKSQSRKSYLEPCLQSERCKPGLLRPKVLLQVRLPAAGGPHDGGSRAGKIS